VEFVLAISGQVRELLTTVATDSLSVDVRLIFNTWADRLLFCRFVAREIILHNVYFGHQFFEVASLVCDYSHCHFQMDR